MMTKLVRLGFTSLLVCLACNPRMMLGQQATPTNNVMSRVAMVESPHGRGTIFSLDVDNREYWITAKHVLNRSRASSPWFDHGQDCIAPHSQSRCSDRTVAPHYVLGCRSRQ